MKNSNVNNRSFRLLAFCVVLSFLGCKKNDLPVFNSASPQLLASGFEELQGSTVGPDEALYVTAPLAGSIWRVNPKNGAFTLFATGLPARNPDPFFIGAGVVDVAFHSGTAYALVTGVGPDLGESDIVGIYRVDGPASNTVIADLGEWSMANPPVPDFFVPTGFQYAFEPYKDGFLVTDGHHNRILYVTLGGDITELIAFGNVVPTGVSLRGNTLYFTQAGPIPHLPETAKLLALSLKSMTANEVATGSGLDAGLFVDVEFGPGPNPYALAQGFWDGPYEGAPANPNTGALLALKSNGSFSVIADGLNQPTSMEIIGNRAYIVSLIGEIWEISFAPGHAGK